MIEGRALRPVRPNAGVAAIYRRRLDLLIVRMAAEYHRVLVGQYEDDPPRLALDAERPTPASRLARKLEVLGAKWEERFEAMAPRLARYFARSVSRGSGASLRSILRDGGVSVRLQMTPALRDVTAASVAENVSLIRSIASQYHTEVSGLVMRSVSAGRDLGKLSKDLQKRYTVTKRRAAFISLDQNNKATSAFNRARQTDLGIEDGVWMHSHAGKEPRPTHLKNDGKKFSLKTGWFDPDPKVREYIMPGQLPRCRCTWRPIVKGLS